MGISIRPFVTTAWILVFTAQLLAGCAGSSAFSRPTDDAATQNGRTPTYQGIRRVAGAGQAALLYAKSAHVEPVVRPISFATSIASLTVKSSVGMIRRTALGTMQLPSLGGSIPAISLADPMDLDVFEAELDRITGTRRSKGTVRFLVGGDAYFTRMEQAIRGAERSIDIRTYIFDNDDYGVAVADLLRERSQDVRVRVLIDSLGNMQAMQIDPESMPDDFRPPFSITTYLEQESSIQVRNTENPWFIGDHTKTTIIDGKIAFLGGMNIGREYRHDWHDLMMEVRGPVVDDLQFESDKAWARAGLLGDLGNFLRFIRGKDRNAENVGYPVRVLKTRSFDAQIYRAQLAAVRRAQRFIWIENPYFSDDRMLYELAKARRRGVDVRIILPTEGNHAIMNASNEVTINKMLEFGIRVFAYPGMSHVKAAVFDGWACIGSANFDKLSLEINKEMNLATSDPETVASLIKQVFVPDLFAATEIRQPLSLTMTARIAEIIADELL